MKNRSETKGVGVVLSGKGKRSYYIKQFDKEDGDQLNMIMWRWAGKRFDSPVEDDDYVLNPLSREASVLLIF